MAVVVDHPDRAVSPEPAGPPSRRAVRWPLALAGLLGAIGLVVGVTGSGVRPGGPESEFARPAGPWGLWLPGPEPWRGAVAVLGVIALTVLVLAFVRLVHLAAGRRLGAGSVGGLAALWSLPFLPAPPMLSLDAFAYAAQGRMVAIGLDPYLVGPSRLGEDDAALLGAVDPIWRDTAVPYGPLALLLLRGASVLGGGETVATVLVLRAVAVVSVVVAVLLAARLATPARRALVTALVAANPIVLVHLVGGVHLDALLAALAAVVLWSARSRWWWLAGIAAAAAFSVKLPGAVLVAYVVFARLRGSTGRRAGLRAVVGTTALVAGATAVFAVLVPHGWGWVGALDTPGAVRSFLAPATLTGRALHGLALLAGVDLSAGTALTIGRLACQAVGALVILALCWRAAGEPSWRRAGTRVGVALVVLSIATPVLYPWYATWGLVLAAVCGTATTHRVLLIGSVLLSFLAIPYVAPAGPWAIVLTVALVVTAVAATVPWRAWARAVRRVVTSPAPVRHPA